MSRVIADRFVNQADKDWFDNEVISTVQVGLGEESKTLAADVKYFVDFVSTLHLYFVKYFISLLGKVLW